MSRFIICRASAGSGKTYTLVRQFIEISISSPSQLEHRFGQILAITFTNKAANGMKSRIMSRLKHIVNGDNDAKDLVDEIATHLGITKQEVVRRCSVLQSAILHHYSELSVCTIDSFVLRVVRTFAHDLRLPMGFSVMLDQSELLQNAVDELMSLAGRDDQLPLTHVLCAYVENSMEDGHSFDVSGSIVKLSEQILKEETPEFLNQLKHIDFDGFIRIFRQLRHDNQQSEKDIAAEAKRFVDACSKKGIVASDFPGKSNGVLSWIQQLADGKFEKANKPYKSVETAFAASSLLGDGKLPAKSVALEELVPLFMEVYVSILQMCRQYNTRQMLMSNLFGMALLNRVNQIIDSLYAENEQVHISEFNKRVNDEVSGESAPFIYERIGSRYHNYLIDEFQDTSKMQWLNFLPLLDEAMTHDFGSDTVEVGTQSLVVGDGKQAIYRFRQGDVRQFIKLPNVDSTVHGLSLKHNARVDTLRDNHRTLGNIVRFNNRFFRKIIGGSFADNPWLTSLYRGDAVGEHDEWELDQHEIFEGGYMQIGFYDEDEMCEAVLRAIRRQVDEFHYGYGDIMVLARYKKTLVQIGNYLTDNAGDSPIPIVSSESFVLSNSRVVLLLQALLQYIYDDKNRLAAYQVSRLTDELDLHVPDISSLNTGLLRSLSLYDCCEELLRLFHLQGMDSAYVSTFLNVVDKYTRNINADLASFNDYLAKNISNLSSTTVSDMQAVQLMTIHKAKGLEAKIVIYVIPEMTGRPQSMWVNVPAEDGEGLPVAYVTSNKERKTAFSDIFKEEELMTQMDRINLLYVAMTRPEHKMYVVCQERNAYDGIDNVSLLHRFVEKDKDCRTEDNVVFEVGEDTMNLAVSSKKKKTAYVVENVSFPTWEDKICIAEQHESQFFDASLFGRPSEDELEDKRLYGILVHDLLSRIMTEADVEPVVNRYCAERHWSESDAAAIRERILRMIHKAENRRFFESGNRVMCEYSLVVNGEVRRPDRIVFSSDETWVVDFKTGRFNKKSHERYLNQVNTYASALTAMGYPNVHSSILYL